MLLDFFSHFTLPFEDPVLIFSLVLFIILLAPLLLKRLRMPGIIGLILAGMAVGPHGFNLLLRDQSIVLFGTVGLLYIMFIAGLEIDLQKFQKNKHKSLWFGAITFLIPLAMGANICYYVLDLNLQASILLAAMFATHTLIAYPLASNLGITKNEAVTITVGGTMITDTLALLVLAVIANSLKGELTTQFWIQLGISLAVYVTGVMWLLPIIGRYFFRSIATDGTGQYIFVLAVVFATSFLAVAAGLEPIIGAFLAGLALNRLIPERSTLMNRIEFVGNAIFIPFFLISVGMLVDLGSLFQGLQAWFVAGVMIATAIVSKWLAAYLTQQFFNYSKFERNVIFGLGSAHAAATLAIVLQGYDMGLFNKEILNGTILVILVTCLVSSFVVETAGRQLAILESRKRPTLMELSDRILVPISKPDAIEKQMDLAVMMQKPHSKDPVYALTVVKEDKDARHAVASSYKMLDKVLEHAAAADNEVKVVSRVDVNISGGIIRAMHELMITEVLIGWNARVRTRDKIFGSVLDNLLRQTRQMIMVSRVNLPINTLKRIVVLLPPNAELETGFDRYIQNMINLSGQIGAPLIFMGRKVSLHRLQGLFNKNKTSNTVSYEVFEEWKGLYHLAQKITPEDLFVIVSARHDTISWNANLDNIPGQLSKFFEQHNFLVIYPEQESIVTPIEEQLG